MTKKQIYQNKAKEIINESIKSVVFIDEKAWNPFEGIKYDKRIEEHLISKKLYENLKRQGINLNIHQYEKGDENIPVEDNKKKYLFRDIDLVLLDWDLVDGDRLNIASLKLLNDVIQQPHIHFCSIYSSTPDFEDIILKIVSYFSGYSREDYENILSCFDFEDSIIEIIESIDITTRAHGSLVGRIMAVNNQILPQVKKITLKDNVECIRLMAIASKSNLPKSDIALEYPLKIISQAGTEHALIINNTIISILSKEKNQPRYLINNFSKLISQEIDKSFFKLLGLDMQNQFSKYGAFINPEILNISFNTFMHHRDMIGANGTMPTFEEFIKDLLIENSKLNLSTSILNVLNSDFLSKFKTIKKNINDAELALINSFYNGMKINKDKTLGFGDIFKDQENQYFLCITALCDCLHPEKIKNKFFFVKHTELLSISNAIKLGDSSHISYIGNSLCIKWSGSEEFVKPKQYYVENNKIISSKIKVKDIVNGLIKDHDLEYLFTLKQNYAQRIANQAFAHPIRVGVDFVKK